MKRTITYVEDDVSRINRKIYDMHTNIRDYYKREMKPSLEDYDEIQRGQYKNILFDRMGDKDE
jgi:hypothetical protein